MDKKGDLLSGVKAASVEISCAKNIGSRRVFEATGALAWGREEPLVKFWLLFEKYAPELASDQIGRTVLCKRNRALCYQPKLGNKEPESLIHFRK